MIQVRVPEPDSAPVPLDSLPSAFIQTGTGFARDVFAAGRAGIEVVPGMAVRRVIMSRPMAFSSRAPDLRQIALGAYVGAMEGVRLDPRVVYVQRPVKPTPARTAQTLRFSYGTHMRAWVCLSLMALAVALYVIGFIFNSVGILVGSSVAVAAGLAVGAAWAARARRERAA